MSNNVIVLITAVIFILILWTIISYRHLSFLRKSILGKWEKIDDDLRKRNDLIPNLIETFRKFFSDKEGLIEELIKARQSACKEYFLGIKKIEYEYNVSKKIVEIFRIADNSGEMIKDTNFLELKKEIFDLNQNIENISKLYNDMVRVYNKHRALPVLKLVAVIFGFKRIDIFEFGS